MKKKLFIQLIAIFLITQIIGLVVGFELVKEGVSVGIVTENPEDVINAFALIAYILIFTFILLLLIKFLKKWSYYLFKLLEVIVIFGTATIVFGVFFYYVVIAVALALLLVILRIVLRKNILLRNVSSIIAAAGAGAVIGVSLGIIPVLLFIVMLAVYDFIAVFKTKHMVTLAKNITKKNLSFTFALPTKEHTFELGTGDMVIPLTLAVSVLASTSQSLAFPSNFVAPIIVLIGSLVGLTLTIQFSSKNIGKALPALPPQAIIMLFMLLLAYLSGFFVF